MQQGFQHFKPRDIAQSVAPARAADPVVPKPWTPPGIGEAGVKTRGAPAAFETSAAPLVSPAAQASAMDDELDALREEARQQGFAKGEAEAQALLAQQSQQLQSAIAALREPMQWLQGEVENQLLTLCKTLATALLGRELRHEPDWLRERLQQAVALLPVNEGTLDLYLHPDDVALLRQTAQHGEPLDPAWVLHESPDIQPGGSVIENRQSQLDERLETRMARLLDDAVEDSHAAEC